MWTGLVRAWFVGRGRPWMWRSVHAISYLMWPIALVHGLSAGRPAATWVIVSYVLCVLAVLIGLAVRLSVSLNRRKDFSSSATGSVKPAGSLVPTTTPPARRPVRRAEADDTGVRMLAGRGATAVLEPWDSDAPVSPAVSARPVPMGPPPISSPPYETYEQRYDERPRRQSGDRPYEKPYDEELYRRGARSRRSEEEAPTPRPRRREEPRYDESRYDEPLARARASRTPACPRNRPPPRRVRAGAGSGAAPTAVRRGRAARGTPPRRRAATRTALRGRVRVRAGAAGPRRRPDEGQRYDDVPRRRSQDRRYDDVPRRRGTGEVRADTGRHSRTEFVDLSDPNDPNYLPPDETPTLVDIAARRARKGGGAARRRPGRRAERRRGRNRR
jgi:hypothetical protein